MRRRSFLATVASIIIYQAVKAYFRYGDRLLSPSPTPTPFPFDTHDDVHQLLAAPTRARARNPFSPLPTPTPRRPLDVMRTYVKQP